LNGAQCQQEACCICGAKSGVGTKMAQKLSCRKMSLELVTKTAYWREIANVQRKCIPNGGSGYCKTMTTKICTDMKDRQQITY